MSVFKNKPDPFFDLVVHDLARSPGLTGVTVGYDGGTWRYKELAECLFDWLPEFALKYSDLADMNFANSRRLLKKAAQTVFTTDKYQKRGEFGELLLHVLIREIFDSQPAISKIFYKSSTNETVKGFDAVHVVQSGEDLELWLGEVKFYKTLSSAIREVVAELELHTDRDYLRNEFMLIESKIDSNWEHAEKLRKLISQRTPLDTVFKNACIPVMLTYESKTTLSHKEICDEFREALTAEIEDGYSAFSKNNLPDLRIHLFLVPLGEKELLTKELQDKLKGQQR